MGEKGEVLLVSNRPSAFGNYLFPSLEGGELDLGVGVFGGFRSEETEDQSGGGDRAASGFAVKKLWSFLPACEILNRWRRKD